MFQDHELDGLYLSKNYAVVCDIGSQLCSTDLATHCIPDIATMSGLVLADEQECKQYACRAGNNWQIAGNLDGGPM